MDDYEGYEDYNYQNEYNQVNRQLVDNADQEKTQLMENTHRINDLLEENKIGFKELDYEFILEFFRNYNNYKQKFELLIDKYIENPELLSKLIRANDVFERLEVKHRNQKNEGKIKIANEEELNNIKQNDHQHNHEDNFPHFEEWDDFEPFDCDICMDEVETVENGKKFHPCGHQYCKECATDYLTKLIEKASVMEIKCPNSGCQQEVGYDDLKRFLPPETFKKYEEFTLKSALDSDPNVRWCPNPKSCGNAIVNEDPSNTKMVCGMCKYEFCFLCQDEYHLGTCEEYENWKLENGKADKKFKEWSKANSKSCPNCKAQIQKNSGCNHMTCYKCKFEFCWLCMRKYTSKHFDLYNVLGCPGLQGGGTENYGFLRRTGVRTGLVVGVVVGVPLLVALAVPTLIIGGPIYGIYKWRKNRRRRRY